jgi:hypothetical protein
MIIKEYIKRNKLSPQGFCKLVGIATPTYYKWINDQGEINRSSKVLLELLSIIELTTPALHRMLIDKVSNKK